MFLHFLFQTLWTIDYVEILENRTWQFLMIFLFSFVLTSTLVSTCYPCRSFLFCLRGAKISNGYFSCLFFTKYHTKGLINVVVVNHKRFADSQNLLVARNYWCKKVWLLCRAFRILSMGNCLLVDDSGWSKKWLLCRIFRVLSIRNYLFTNAADCSKKSVCTVSRVPSIRKLSADRRRRL